MIVARCVDLFAGTGALGLEAASRGAAEVVLIEQHPAAIGGIRQSLERLNCDRVELWEGDAFRWLEQASDYDLVFVDPPFDSGLWEPALDLLSTSAALRAGGLVYLEHARSENGFCEAACMAGGCFREKRMSAQCPDAGFLN